MKQKKITIKDLLNFNLGNYKLLNQGYYSTNNRIKGDKIVTKWLQLLDVSNGFDPYLNYLVGWGKDEYFYLSKLKSKDIRDKIKKVINSKTPAVILSKNFKSGKVLNILIEIAESIHIPIYQFNDHITGIFVLFHNLISKKLIEIKILHASFVVINNVGVLIKGSSGIGKSESVLEIIQKNHIFVGDDSIEVYKNGDHIYGKSSKITKDLLEIRGIGLINIPFIYGQKSIVDAARIDLIVELLEANDKDVNFDRIGIDNLTEEILNKKIPKILIPIKAGRTISSLIIAAVSVYVAKKEGMDPLKMIKLRSQ